MNQPQAMPDYLTGSNSGVGYFWGLGFLCGDGIRDETVQGDLNKEVDMGIFGGTYAFSRWSYAQAEFDNLQRQFVMVEAHRSGGYGTLSYHFGATGVAIGTIKMWGTVIEHEKGYRAEYAKLNSLDDHYGGIDFQQMKAYYGV